MFPIIYSIILPRDHQEELISFTDFAKAKKYQKTSVSKLILFSDSICISLQHQYNSFEQVRHDSGAYSCFLFLVSLGLFWVGFVFETKLNRRVLLHSYVFTNFHFHVWFPIIFVVFLAFFVIFSLIDFCFHFLGGHKFWIRSCVLSTYLSLVCY